jgi:hypothetical protein
MSPEARKPRTAAPERFEWDAETLKRAGMDAAQGAALARSLSDFAEKRQAEELDKAWQEAQQMLALWEPYTTSILQQLRTKGVAVDALRALMEQSALEQDPSAARDRLLNEFSEQRPLMLNVN